ncbi:hypothetical protein [Microvirga massiliensis]|uniref:hypothetical protein n=1 Tax=Microvirga massiliensis TaxID=1033741 RepID=UPI0006606605|nr:hypothetical protein [Microvirga massiliensis]
MQENPLRPRYRLKRNRIDPDLERYGLRTIQSRSGSAPPGRLLLALWNLPYMVLSTVWAKLR